ncbi:MAG: hypothetical protein ACI89X_004201 [Planctomycetota bacterium]|jgi:hypothetical protein
MNRLHATFVLLVCSSLCLAQSANDINVRAYEKRLKEELLETGQRHVDLGWGVRNSGLIPQCTYQLVLAVELSEGTHGGAKWVLNVMRTYKDAFWKKKRKKPMLGAQKSYEKKATALVKKDMKGQIKLARAAGKAKLTDKMTAHLVKAMRYGAEITFNKSGAKIEGFKIEDELAKWLSEQTVTLKNGERRFEPAGKGAPRLEGLEEVADKHLIVRTDLDAAAAKELHALGSALWAPLQKRLDGAPTRTLRLIVFAKKVDYDAYLKAIGHSGVVSKGLCDYGTFQTLVCAEGLESGSVNALVLHELSHLFFFGSSPVAMPDWYAEGFAESFGGQGTFAWNGKVLTVGGLMRSNRLDAIQENPMTVEQVLAGNAMNLLRQDHDKAMRFYAMSWALQRFLTTGKHRWQKRFLDWEAKCRGTLLGTQSIRKFGSPGSATESFLAEFRRDMPLVEVAFQAWLTDL